MWWVTGNDVVFPKKIIIALAKRLSHFNLDYATEPLMVIIRIITIRWVHGEANSTN